MSEGLKLVSDLLVPIYQAIAQEITSELLDFCKRENISSTHRDFFSVKNDDIQSLIDEHLRYVKNWSSSISVYDREIVTKKFDDIYVPQVFAFHKKDQSPFSASELVNEENVSIIFGPPGAGKSTTIKYICNQLLGGEGNIKQTIQYPFLIRLRELRSNENISDLVLRTIGVTIDVDYNTINRDNGEKIREFLSVKKRKISIDFFNNTNACLLLDGYDEINTKIITRINNEISEYINKIEYSKIIITCRTGALNIKLDGVYSYYIQPFNHEQILYFIENWFNDKEKETEFLHKVKESPFFDTVGRPLRA